MGICGHEMDDGYCCMQVQGHDTKTVPHMNNHEAEFFWRGYHQGQADGTPRERNRND